MYHDIMYLIYNHRPTKFMHHPTTNLAQEWCPRDPGWLEDWGLELIWVWRFSLERLLQGKGSRLLEGQQCWWQWWRLEGEGSRGATWWTCTGGGLSTCSGGGWRCCCGCNHQHWTEDQDCLQVAGLVFVWVFLVAWHSLAWRGRQWAWLGSVGHRHTGVGGCAWLCRILGQ